MLMDLYRSMNKEFHPTATDIASFARIFDRDNKGKITFEDMTKFALKYYCNEDYWLTKIKNLTSFDFIFKLKLVKKFNS